MATAYTIRYGKANAGLGPAVWVVVSFSVFLGEDAGLEISLGEGIVALVVGGGSIAELLVGAFDGTTGSGNADIASSPDDVSIVICAVGLVLRRCV